MPTLKRAVSKSPRVREDEMNRWLTILSAIVLSAALYSDAQAQCGAPGCDGHGGQRCCCDHPHHHHHLLAKLFRHGHHGGHCCCGCREDDQSRSRDESPAEAFARSTPMAPSGPIVESYPMMRATPAMIAMPMMMGYSARNASYDTQSRDDCGDRCQKQIDDLDERVAALDLRLKTIQRAVELQTQILEEIKAQGTIGNSPMPVKPK